MPHVIALAPKGPFTTWNRRLTLPLASEVTLAIPARLQSPGPVAAPLSAHSVTTSASFGEKPEPVTWTSAEGARSERGATLRCGPEGAEDVLAGVVVAAGRVVVGWLVAGWVVTGRLVDGALLVGGRTTIGVLFAHPLARNATRPTAPVAAATGRRLDRRARPGGPSSLFTVSSVRVEPTGC